jgi:hypothetical protein
MMNRGDERKLRKGGGLGDGEALNLRPSQYWGAILRAQGHIPSPVRDRQIELGKLLIEDRHRPFNRKVGKKGIPLTWRGFNCWPDFR